ncbi:MAG TPA: glycine oxidase ThiO [Candidatus Baltobacteraceae bacterium]|nr:glycine oxidase ThiO [Candidatus Baltobacteraceae bacterium]
MLRSSDNADVAIVGAGIIGLAIAFELAGRGAEVCVFDRGEPARAASWAAAGMLAPRSEHMPDSHTQRLCEESLALYPGFVADVRACGAIDPQLRLDGIVHAAYDAGELAKLEDRAAQLRKSGCAADMLTRNQTVLQEPALGRGVLGALLVHREGQIDNRRLGRALLEACRSRAVQIQTGIPSLSIEFDARRVLGIRTALGYRAAGAVINAAGAWAAGLAGVPPQCVPPVRAVKGQMLCLEIPAGYIRRPVWVPGAYLVPRADGRLLIGATVEEATDVHVTPRGLRDLLQAATAALPALADFPITETWAGLRPGTPDDRPFIGPTARDGYFLATGHYRNGILLAPKTANMVAAQIAGASLGEYAAFLVDRAENESRRFVAK